ncbi:hypothetical protein HWV62_6124 [Athelia sp. TMB]|nr:hypothetical protein HWV62_6124 [Athelia sp. TMB]
MYRALPVSRQVASTTGRGAVRIIRRSLATAGEVHTPGTVAAAPKKGGSVVRKILVYTTAAAGTFYVGSVFVAFSSPRYYDFFSESVPLGQAAIAYAEKHDWDELTTDSILHGTIEAVGNVSQFISSQFGGPSDSTKEKEKAKTEQKLASTKAVVQERYAQSKEAVKSATSAISTKVVKGQEKLVDATKLTLDGVKKAADGVKHTEPVKFTRDQLDQFSDGVEDLVRKAEAALADAASQAEHAAESIPSAKDSAAAAIAIATPVATEVDDHVYSAQLPLGHELPYGFHRPSPPKPAPDVQAKPTPAPLPLVAPAVAGLGISEPVIAQLASTIDSLASYLDSNPAAAEKAKDVLETAKLDLTGLATRIESVKAEQKEELEKTLDGQAKEYSAKLVELEMAAQDKLDMQEDEFRKFYDSERAKFVQAYRQKLDHELQTQTELINERLKEEVIAQGIELQRRWIRDIKVKVEQERGGRLAKLDELAAGLKRLERVALDNSVYLDENIRVHALWSAIRALNSTVESPIRKPFREELRVLRHIAAAKEDPVAVSALETLETSDVPDVGVEPFADLASWFTTSVAPRVSSVALVPDQDAGVLSHLASHLLSSFRFQRHGLVPGSDVLSVLARAEHYMNEKDLDSATRELNQLGGTAKVLLSDWLAAARRRLEVLQALEVVQSQATLASLLVV